jgi:opacity protein-like surface antigen
LEILPEGVARVNTTIEAVEPQGSSGGSFRRWGLSLHAGASIPHGNFDNVFNPGPNFGVDLEYRVTRSFSLEGIYGFHRFNGETFGTFSVGDLNVHQFSFNGKVYGSSAPVRPFVNFGGGAYVFTPGVSTHGGLNVGGGVQFDVTPTFAVDAMYNFHNVFTSGSNTRFSAVQGGVRFRF